MKDDWHNNEISKKLDEEYPHDFSICDIDGACRCFYRGINTWDNRFIIYESKRKSEEASQTQLQTLYVIDQNFKWENFDEKSGVFFIRHDDEIWNLELCKIRKVVGFQKPIFEPYKIADITMDDFYNIVSATDKRNKVVYITKREKIEDKQTTLF